MEKPEILSIKKCPWSAHKTNTLDSENSDDILISQVGDARMIEAKPRFYSLIICTVAGMDLILQSGLARLHRRHQFNLPIKDWMWLGSNPGRDARMIHDYLCKDFLTLTELSWGNSRVKNVS